MPPTTSPVHPGIRRGPVRRSPRRLRRRVVAGLAGGAVAAAVVGLAIVHDSGSSTAAAQCTANAGAGSYTLTPEQMQNAAVISAVAVGRSLPDHAVTIAIATSLQESKLRNLSYGDRDSIGLFQQRPSQGWGTAAQVADPVYASGAFYTALTKLPDWQDDSVAIAAQAVQHSADGSAYEQWEGEARALAIGLTGEQPGVITCSGGDLSVGKARATVTRAQVGTAVATALGATALASNGQLGQAAAAWLVAHSQAYAISSVSFAGSTWSARTGAWAPSAHTAGVTFTLAPPRTS